MPIPFVTFKPAEYRSGENSYIFFYALDPTSNKLKRKIVKLNHIHKKTDRDRYARLMLHTINEKLFAGWNPFLEEMAAKGVTIEDAIAKFMAVKTKNLRKDTLRSYRSFTESFLHWLKDNRMSDKFCVLLDKACVIRYLDYLEVEKSLSNRSYNNYASFMFTLFEFFVSKDWIKENPAADIPKKRIDNKTRIIIPKDVRKRIKDYFLDTTPSYYYVMLLCYRMLIRPKEIAMLKIENVDFKNGILTIPSFVAKNHNERSLGIPDEIMDYFKSIAMMPSDWYIFSDRNTYRPGKKPMAPTRISERWSEMRDALHLPKEYQFYSLKDTGITEMLEAGVAPKYVKELADHHSLEMTEKYTHRSNAKKIMEATKLDF